MVTMVDGYGCGNSWRVFLGRCIGSLFHEIFMKLLKCKVIWCIINDSSVGQGRAGDGRDAYDKKGRTVL